MFMSLVLSGKYRNMNALMRSYDRGNRAVAMALAEWNGALGAVGLVPEMVAVDFEILRAVRCQLRVARGRPY